jgi:LysM repeat protein
LTSAERLRAGQVIRVPVAVAEATPPSPPDANGARTHLVRRGETLTAIASRYRVSLSALLEANGLSSAAVIKAGSRITIPN